MTAAAPAITHKKILMIAMPIMLSNLSEPLIGIVDTAVVGQLPQAHFIGAVAVAALIFSIVYWGFGSLRMGTGGLAAQAFGAGDKTELRAVFARALIISTALGFVILAFSPLISRLAFWLLEASPQIETEARKYFDIRIWSAPFALANYVILGWFIGMGRTSIAFFLQLLLNLINMGLDGLFVLVYGMTADGVALGTLLAEIAAAFVGLVLVFVELKKQGGHWSMGQIFLIREFRRTVAVNTDIMVRSLALTFAFSYFIAQSAKISDIAVAANAILMHIFESTAYFLDGFAFAVEALAGQMVGAKSRPGFLRAVKMTSVWGGGVALALSLSFLMFGPLFIDLLTVNETVRQTARTYLVWAAIAPVVGVACFQLDGIFTGATQTADMRNMMLISLAVFIAAIFVLVPFYGNHGLWAALMIFLLMRAVTLGVRMPALLRNLF